jgi:hypothetical protein
LTSDEVVRTVVAAEVAALMAGLLTWFGVAAARAFRRARTSAAEAEAREIVGGLLVAREPGLGGIARLRQLPRSVQVRVLTDVARNLTGVPRDRIADIAVMTGLAAWAREASKSDDRWRRLHAARFFSVAGGGDDVVRRLLRDPDPLVRTEAVEWAATDPDDETTAALVGLLDDVREPYHFAVMDALVRIGAPSVPHLVRWLEGRAGDSARPGLRVAACLPDARFLPSALRLCSDAAPASRELAVALAGTLGGAEAVEALLRAAGDESAPVRAAAARGLGHLRHWPAAATLRDLLRDRSWTVRREAGLALRALGAPGEIVLRRMLSDSDRFAAATARHLLDWPERPVTGAIPR